MKPSEVRMPPRVRCRSLKRKRPAPLDDTPSGGPALSAKALCVACGGLVVLSELPLPLELHQQTA